MFSFSLVSKTVECLLKESDSQLENSSASRFRAHCLNGEWIMVKNFITKSNFLFHKKSFICENSPNIITPFRLYLYNSNWYYCNVLFNSKMIFWNIPNKIYYFLCITMGFIWLAWILRYTISMTIEILILIQLLFQFLGRKCSKGFTAIAYKPRLLFGKKILLIYVFSPFNLGRHSACRKTY